MRVKAKLSAEEKKRFDTFQNEPLIRTKKIAIRIAIALGLSKMVEGESTKLKGDELIGFNTTTVDPDGIFEVIAYYIISQKMGASINKKKIILVKKEEIAETIAEAFVLGLYGLPMLQWPEFFH